MGFPRDITGRRFGRLVAIRPVGKDIHRNILWLCRCDCGGTRIIAASPLISDCYHSCGCLKNQGHVRHGYGRKGANRRAEYNIWQNMLKRCNNPGDKAYKNYGGRGIKVCKRWLRFENFLADVGNRPHPKLTIDRTNNDGDYKPSNVRWATRRQQRLNQRPR